MLSMTPTISILLLLLNILLVISLKRKLIQMFHAHQVFTIGICVCNTNGEEPDWHLTYSANYLRKKWFRWASCRRATARNNLHVCRVKIHSRRLTFDDIVVTRSLLQNSSTPSNFSLITFSGLEAWTHLNKNAAQYEKQKKKLQVT
jgi:hypothetical protein